MGLKEIGVFLLLVLYLKKRGVSLLLDAAKAVVIERRTKAAHVAPTLNSHRVVFATNS